MNGGLEQSYNSLDATRCEDVGRPFTALVRPRCIVSETLKRWRPLEAEALNHMDRVCLRGEEVLFELVVLEVDGSPI